jgi:cytochrome oxidase assembly protein ShyY1
MTVEPVTIPPTTSEPMKRVPVIATIVVVAAIALMIALGIWQLHRRGEKAALLSQYAANITRPEIAFPSIPVDDSLLFRKAGGLCLEPAGWTERAGRNAQGGSGWRQIAQCRTGAEGPGMAVQVGVARAAGGKPQWKGGEVHGYITHAPDNQPLILSLFGAARPKTLMLVANAPIAGLDANPGPDLSAVPNNHLAYAVQWFVFAALAAIIYALALRRRTVAESAPPR